jgi:hypothetical protein
MKPLRFVFCLLGLSLGMASFCIGQDYSLPYFMSKVSSGAGELSKAERTELLNRIEEMLSRARRSNGRITQTIQAGEMEIRYQEGKFWMGRLEADQSSVENATEQIRILREKPSVLASVRLYKSLRDLAFNFNAYINVSAFVSFVGDLAPEVGMWADPVFYQLFLLPQVQGKGLEAKGNSNKGKKPEAKPRKPEGSQR